jgi:FkbM family methyltransferase
MLKTRQTSSNLTRVLLVLSTNVLALTAIIAVISLYPRFPFYLMAFNGQCPTTQSEGNANFYSQEYEDYILSQVFNEVNKGTYIDVGASDPNEISVTKYFYLKGWHGINIEPMEHVYKLLVKHRPNDFNLKTGASDKVGSMDFYQVFNDNDDEISALSTFDRAVAYLAIGKGFNLKISKIPVTTLNNILEEHPLPVINFMKIDVEGLEEQVLRGLDLAKFRPQVFIIEATIPQTTTPSHQNWEPILLQNGYTYQMFDGLNRYYLSNESQALEKNFARVKVCVDAHRHTS